MTLNTILRRLRRVVHRPFPGSHDYWIERYAAGGSSGAGSYGAHAQFKADVLNEFVTANGIRTVVEFGCGDGNQLRLAQYPQYVGYDVSPIAVDRCRALFASDSSKVFRTLEEFDGSKADLCLSLDVVYHLVENEVFEDYMRRLFDSALRFVIIYSSNTDDDLAQYGAHVRHRRFTDWVAENRREWKLSRMIPNRHPYDPRTGAGSFADFYIYQRT